jgi:hypothetical protein
MAVTITDAYDYFSTRLFSDEWWNSIDSTKTSALTTAENMIKSHFVLKSDAESSTAYLHAVCEQALHLLQFNKERFRLQQEGVTSYGVEDMSFKMENSLFSPIVRGFLNPIRLKAGDIV